jgi:hypothetical protein
MTIFSPEEFMRQTTTAASTRRPPLTANEEYVGVTGTPTFRQTQGKEDPSKMYTWLDVPVTIDLSMYPSEKERVGVDRVTLRFSQSVEFSDNGQILWDRLRNIREATGTNEDGKAFAVPMLEGRPIRVRIGHTEYPKGSGEILDQITRVAKP